MLGSEVYAVVARIPPGKVATYGQVAELAGYAGRARQVGYALAALIDDAGVPWHRVINTRGQVSARSHTKLHELQRHLLECEGIVFVNDRVDLDESRWQPDEPWAGGDD